MAAKRDRSGRYDRVHEAERPSAREFLPEGVRAHGNVIVMHARVEKPGETVAAHLQFGKFQRVAVNVAKDTLEREYAYGRISREQYEAGRLFEHLLEAARIGGGSMSLERVGGGGDHEATIANAIDRATAAVDFEAEVRSACGLRGALVLRAILGDGQTFTQIAAAEGLGAKRGPSVIAREFREVLAVLAKHLERRIWRFGALC